jgi:hypothetical protein
MIAREQRTENVRRWLCYPEDPAIFLEATNRRHDVTVVY